MCVVEGAKIANFVVSAVRGVQMYTDIVETKKQNEAETKQFISEAKKAHNQALMEKQEGIEEARRQKLNSILNIQKAKAAFASKNISVNSQSALNIYSDEKLNGELQALNIVETYDKRAEKYNLASEEYYKKANLTSLKSKNALKNAVFKSIKGEITSLIPKIGD